MTNYIQTLQDRNRRLESELASIKQGLTDLRVYLSSSKFQVDTTVQVSDIFLRLEEAEAPPKDELVSGSVTFYSSATGEVRTATIKPFLVTEDTPWVDIVDEATEMAREKLAADKWIGGQESWVYETDNLSSV